MAKHKRLSNPDRLIWAVLSRWWHCWKDALVIVRPETVIRWHPFSGGCTHSISG
jgi:hypothetical protein